MCRVLRPVCAMCLTTILREILICGREEENRLWQRKPAQGGGDRRDGRPRTGVMLANAAYSPILYSLFSIRRPDEPRGVRTATDASSVTKPSTRSDQAHS